MSHESTITDESEELTRFREQWKSEVRQKKQPPPAPVPPSTSSPASTSTIAHLPPTDAPPLPPNVVSERPFNVFEVARLSATTPAPAAFVSNVSIRARNNAINVYRQAVRCEQASQLDEALRLYRTAFRMDSDVDKAYHKAEQQALTAATAAGQRPPGHRKTSSADSAVERVTQSLKGMDLPSAHAHHAHHEDHAHHEAHVTGLLAKMVKDFPSVLFFEPEDETESTPLNSLPDEVLIHILGFLNTSALERFGSTCRKARVLTLEPSFWRRFVETTYKPPQIADDEDLDAIVDAFDADYRRIFIERPRVRLDGVYIAVCHYIRQGISENAWVNMSHLITYHRYLRFFSNGQVISLLANEEFEPQQIIPIFRPGLRMKGFYIGTWTLRGTTVFITNLYDPANASARYSFQMTLALRSRPLGRWNKLEFVGYDSVDAEGEASPLALKNERPFWFSKVRSYAAAAKE